MARERLGVLEGEKLDRADNSPVPTLQEDTAVLRLPGVKEVEVGRFPAVNEL